MTRATWSSLSVGRATSGQRDAVVATRVHRATRPVIYLAGVASDAGEAVPTSVVASVAPLLRYLVAEIPLNVIAPTVTATWGNATTTSRIDDVLAWARATGVATDEPPILIGASHGGACALTYARTHEVACVVGLIPAVDLEAIRVSNTLSLRASIDAAWGVTYPAALPAGADPSQNDPGCPVQIWYATDDAVSENVVSYASAISADLHSVGALGHSDAAIAAVDEQEVLAFVESVG